MFRNYLLTALGNFARHKLYSFINICGLAVGLACVLFVMFFVRDELSYDKWLPDTANLYSVEDTLHVPDRAPLNLARSPFPMAATMKDQVPEVRAMTRLVTESITVTVGDRQFFDTIDVVDPNFLQVIKLSLTVGDPDKVLNQPESLVLSQAMAKKYFGDADPIGRIATIGNANCKDDGAACMNRTISLKVTGVLRDLPHNSQLIVNALMPNTSTADLMSQHAKQNWLSFNPLSYVVLAPGTNPQTVIRKMQPILDNVLGGDLKQAKLMMRGSQVLGLHLIPFTHVHLNSEIYSGSMTPTGSWITVYGVVVIGLLILLVACFNFMNLATARALSRAREISLRKTLGASRRQLIVQFLGEAVLMALLSLVLALAVAEMLLPMFDQFLGRPIAFHYSSDWPMLFAILAVALGAGLISGSYPALVLSRFRPAAVLRTNSSGQVGSGQLRGFLVVLQFSVSIGLGIAAIVVFSQINFARNVALGFRYDKIVVLAGDALSPNSRDSFSQTLRSNPGVLDTALSNGVPFGSDFNIGLAEVPGALGKISINRVSINPDFARLYSIPLVAGRMFSRTRSEDTFVDDRVPTNEGHNVIVNELGAARLGFTPQQAIGKMIIFNNYHVHIVGVLADAKFDGAREPVKPIIYYNDPNENSTISIWVRNEGRADTATFIDKTWHAFAPMTSSRRAFLNDNFNKLYSGDERQGAMFGIFVSITIFIACLGLFGLAALTASRRTKEIGIRKVFGGRAHNIVVLLLWQFSIPVVIANLIAWPIAWLYLHDWLQGFALRISLNPLYFLAAAVIALLIAWATIIVHALRVASSNPVHALRYE